MSDTERQSEGAASESPTADHGRSERVGTPEGSAVNSRCDPRRVEPLRRQTFNIVVSLLIVGFLLALLERNYIRSWWWAWRLTQSTEASDRAFYVASLTAVGDPALGATRYLARHQRPDIRSMAVAVLGHLSQVAAPDVLAGLLADEDREVRESAALTLAFMRSAVADQLLIAALNASHDAEGIKATMPAHPPNTPSPSMSMSEAPPALRAAEAAAAVLGRRETEAATLALCRAAKEHPVARIRAQAIESLSDAASGPSGELICTTLVGALTDAGTFTGSLALEREVAGAEAFANSRKSSDASGAIRPRLPHEIKIKAVAPQVSDPNRVRTVAEIAAKTLQALTGRSVQHPENLTPAERAELIQQCRASGR